MTNTLTGNGGNDTLDGGDGVDAIGGDGNDYYVVDSAFVELVNESGTGTQDVVEIQYTVTPGTLTAGVAYANTEGLVYSGAGVVHLLGTTGDNFLGGNGEDHDPERRRRQ